MSSTRILEGAGSAFALLGLAVSGVISGASAAHLLDTVWHVDCGILGLNTLIKTFIEYSAGLAGAYLHRISTFTLRYTVGFQLRTDCCGLVTAHPVFASV